MKSLNQSSCCGCGARFPERDGPVHRYMSSSPACWAAYGEVLAREYTDPRYARLHRLSVDAYAVQHPGSRSAHCMQSVAVHLCRLCVLIEYQYGIERANEVMLAVKRRPQQYRWLEPPRSLGAVTVADVVAADDPTRHLTEVRRWAESSWAAWAQHHAVIRSWLPPGLGREAVKRRAPQTP